jgi:hypothetical protein
MRRQIDILIKKIAKTSTLLGSAFVLVGMLSSIVHLPAEAAGDSQEISSGETESKLQACTPPDGWDQTVRLYYTKTASKEWNFEVSEPEMDVVLTIFYFQDHDSRGCPFDCSAGDCQTDETGLVETPLGSKEISDGQLGASSGSEKLEGRLSQGSYSVVVSVTGQGSINVGLKVKTASVPIDTAEPEPTDTQIPTFTPTATEITSTPTPITEDVMTPTPTEEITAAPPKPNITATPTATGTGEPTVLPPVPSGTPGEPGATPTATSNPPKNEKPTNTPPPTFAPPTPPANVTQAPALIPVTGADLSVQGNNSNFYKQLMLRAGIGLLGLGLVFHGIAAGLSRKKSQG